MYKTKLSEKAIFLLEHPRNEPLIHELCALLDKHYNTIKYNYIAKNTVNGPLTAVGVVNFLVDKLKLQFNEVTEEVK